VRPVIIPVIIPELIANDVTPPLIIVQYPAKDQ
jgi:hypothetical protein